MSRQPIRVGINGFGRIGRLTFRFAWDMMNDIEIVHVNEILGGTETAAYLVKYDSVHGIWPKEVEMASPTAFTVDGKTVSFSDRKDFTQVDWKSLGVELVIDCSGKFLTVEKLRPYIDVCGVKRVVVSAPVKEPSVLNVVVGVNDHELNESHVICTAASCTTNCIAPVIKVIHEKLTIEKGMITTVRCRTSARRKLQPASCIACALAARHPVRQTLTGVAAMRVGWVLCTGAQHHWDAVAG